MTTRKTGRQVQISTFEDVADDVDEALTDAEREVWKNVEKGDYGPRKFARETNRSPGTISNLLARARSKKQA